MVKGEIKGLITCYINIIRTYFVWKLKLKKVRKEQVHIYRRRKGGKASFDVEKKKDIIKSKKKSEKAIT